MAKFNFRLQNFLQLKEKLEDQKRIEFGNAAKALEQEKQRKAAMELEKAGCLEELRRETLERVSPITIELWNGYIEALKTRIIAQQVRIDRAAEFLEVKRAELVEAMRDRKAIEVLRDKAKEEYRIEEKRAEQKLLDELVSSRAARES